MACSLLISLGLQSLFEVAMILKGTLITNLMLICSLLIACQKGKKVESEATVYSSNIQLCDQYAQNLKDDNIDLDSRAIQTSLGQFPINPPHILPENTNIEAIDNLENFIIIAEKTFKLIDEKVVVFPNKNQFLRRLKLAYYYLGEWNSDLSILNDRPFISSQVDYAEFRYQFKKAMISQTIVDNAHLPYNAKTKEMGSLEKFNTATLKKLEDESYSVCFRFGRVRVLTSRSKWDSKASFGEALSRSEASVLGIVYDSTSSRYCSMSTYLREHR